MMDLAAVTSINTWGAYSGPEKPVFSHHLPNQIFGGLNRKMAAPKGPKVFFDILIGKAKAGRIKMALYSELAPRTAENFKCLCTGEKGKGLSGKPLHYKGSAFHRIVPGFMSQGGDITRGDGTGGESIYGPKFADEDFIMSHSVPGLLSMANYGPNTNNSHFFITTAPATWLDNKHVVFGYVFGGYNVLYTMEDVGSESGATSAKVVIEDCGEITED